MSNYMRSNNASPFIKRDQLRRDFLRTKLRRDDTSKINIKKESSDLVDEKAKKLLHNHVNNHNYSNISTKGSTDENEYDEFLLRAVNAEKLDHVKTHLLKFQSKKQIDPARDFHLPVRLHRKDTRNLQFQLTRAEIVQRQKEIIEYKHRSEAEKSLLSNSTPQEHPSDGSISPTGNNISNENIISNSLGDKDSKSTISNPSYTTRLEVAGLSSDLTKVGQVKYDGKEEHDIDYQSGTINPLADVAPDGGGRFRRGNPKRKTRQLKLLDENAKKLRFEEFYPWVMEDFDGLNTWVGSYEAGNSDSYVFLSVEDDGSFTMIPADKVYRFTARNKYATLTIEEAEKRMEKNGGGAPRWLMKHLDNIGTTTTRYDRTRRRLRTVDGNGHENDNDHEDNSEIELDYDEEFPDDEEAPIIDGNEEENRESEQRIKREMLQANALGLRDDHLTEIDNDDLFGEKKIDEEGEKVKKALLKTDLGALYESDNDSNPYLSDSDQEENEEGNIKKEEDVEDKLNRKFAKKKKISKTHFLGPSIQVKSINNCIIVLSANKTILANFPTGNWNPCAANYQPGNSYNHTSKTIQEGYEDEKFLLTEEDVINAIRGKKLTLKQLIRELKEKVNKHPENKLRMKTFVKKLVKLNGKFLELADQ